MPETPKEKSPSPLTKEKDASNEASLTADQRDRGYYYDDAHGYTVYDPEGDRSDDDEQDDPDKGRPD